MIGVGTGTRTIGEVVEGDKSVGTDYYIRENRIIKTKVEGHGDCTAKPVIQIEVEVLAAGTRYKRIRGIRNTVECIITRGFQVGNAYGNRATTYATGKIDGCVIIARRKTVLGIQNERQKQ